MNWRSAGWFNLQIGPTVRSTFQVHGSSCASSWALVRPETIRSSTSVSQAKGSTPFSFAVATRLATIAQWRAPPSEPANRLVP